MAIQMQRLLVSGIIDETGDTYTLKLAPPQDADWEMYRAGQYLTIEVEVEGTSLRRAYSLSSTPGLDMPLALTIKRVPDGRVSNFLRDELQVGDHLNALPPMGHFVVEPNPERAKRYVLIGAGSGITPLYAIARAVLSGEPQSKVSLWYGNRKEADIIFADALAALRKQYPERFEVYHTLTQPGPDWEGDTGRLDRDRIYSRLLRLFMEDELRKQYYVCGPQGLIEGAQRAFDRHAVWDGDVYIEYFSAPVPTEEQIQAAYAAPVDDSPVRPDIQPRQIQLTLNGETREIPVDPQDYILDAALAADLDPPYACQGGICSTCRAKCLSGDIHMDLNTGLSPDEIESGYVLTCVAHPLSDDVHLSYDE